MKKIILLFCLLFVFGCQSQEQKENPLVTACKDIIKKDLKDPYSVMWDSIDDIEIKDSALKVHAIKIEYNAKNSYGAYAGSKTFYCQGFVGANNTPTASELNAETWYTEGKKGKTHTEIQDLINENIKQSTEARKKLKTLNKSEKEYIEKVAELMKLRNTTSDTDFIEYLKSEGFSELVYVYLEYYKTIK